MSIKAKVIEVGGAFRGCRSQAVTMEVNSTVELRAIAGHLYENVTIIVDGERIVGGSKVCATCETHCQVIEDLDEQINWAHNFLDKIKITRTDSNRSIISLRERIQQLYFKYRDAKAANVEAAGLMVEATVEPELLAEIQPCVDCGAEKGQLCNKGCTQESYT